MLFNAFISGDEEYVVSIADSDYVKRYLALLAKVLYMGGDFVDEG